MDAKEFEQFVEDWKPFARRYATQRNSWRCSNTIDDIVANAVLEVFKLWLRKPDLGYDTEIGGGSTFYKMIWSRAVLKGARSSIKHKAIFEFNFDRVSVEHKPFDNVDLMDAVELLDEKDRLIARHVISGSPVDSLDMNCSMRTKYRHVKRVVQNLTKLVATPDDQG